MRAIERSFDTAALPGTRDQEAASGSSTCRGRRRPRSRSSRSVRRCRRTGVFHLDRWDRRRASRWRWRECRYSRDASPASRRAHRPPPRFRRLPRRPRSCSRQAGIRRDRQRRHPARIGRRTAGVRRQGIDVGCHRPDLDPLAHLAVAQPRHSLEGRERAHRLLVCDGVVGERTVLVQLLGGAADCLPTRLGLLLDDRERLRMRVLVVVREALVLLQELAEAFLVLASFLQVQACPTVAAIATSATKASAATAIPRFPEILFTFSPFRELPWRSMSHYETSPRQG